VTAAHDIRHFRHFTPVYFHSCVYDRVSADARFDEPIPLNGLFHRHDRGTRPVLVGDAHMDPGELTARWGAIDSTRRNEQPEIASMNDSGITSGTRPGSSRCRSGRGSHRRWGSSPGSYPCTR
jgi:hypothetical protein